MNGTETQYDCCGVFSGSIFSRLVDGQRVLYLFYTSVSTFPYPHWSRPYIEQESQSVAVSTDFGRSWHRYQHNPILVAAPARTFTTGWRDPFVSEWTALSKLRGVHPSTTYMLLASGDKRTGPQLLLYESQELLNWKILGVLVQGQVGLPITPGSKSDLRMGENFECASFTTLGGRHYIFAGVEQHPSKANRYASRYTLWMSGNLELDINGKPTFTITSFGRLDLGIMYAPHIFRGPKNEVLQLGWADEDENCMTSDQGWAGGLTLPRELYEISLPIPHMPLVDEHMWEINYAKKTMTTLGIRPPPQMKALRAGSKLHDLDSLSTVQSQTFEIEANFTYLSGNEVLTFNVRQAPHDREVTRIIVSLPEGTIHVDRSASSLANGNSMTEGGSFQLFDTSTSQEKCLEDLHVRIFVDNSIIEVYANDRFALSSRVYPTLDSALGVSCTFRAGNGVEQLEKGKVAFMCWEGLINAWPGREVVREEIAAAKNDDTKNLAEVHIKEPHLQAIIA